VGRGRGEQVAAAQRGDEIGRPGMEELRGLPGLAVGGCREALLRSRLRRARVAYPEGVEIDRRPPLPKGRTRASRDFTPATSRRARCAASAAAAGSSRWAAARASTASAVRSLNGRRFKAAAMRESPPSPRSAQRTSTSATVVGR